MKIWNVGVIGCGGISEIFFENMIHKRENLKVVSCCSKYGESARIKAEKYQIKATTLEEMLADPEVDVVVNLTPAKDHYQILKAALMAGKHAYTEKVMTETYEQARELTQLAQEMGLMLGVAPDTIFGAGIQTAKNAVDQGMIGEVTGCVACINRNVDVMYERIPFLMQPGAGIGFDFGIYFLTTLLYILGPVVEVSGRMATRNPIRTYQLENSKHLGETYEVQNENIMTGLLEFKNGVFGTVMFNGNCIFPEKPYLAIQGTKGILYLPDSNQFGGKVILQKHMPGGEEELQPVNDYMENERGIGVSEMMRAFEQGDMSFGPKGLAVNALEILEGITKSSQSRQFVKLNSTF